MRLGPSLVLTCEQARNRAIVIIPTVRNGEDPAAERAAEMQLRAMATVDIKLLPPEAGHHAHHYRLKPTPLDATFDLYAR